MMVPDSGKLPIPPLSLGIKNLGIYKREYYDEPEGKDLIGKLIGTNRIGFATGFFTAWVDCSLYTKPKTITGILGRFGYWITPCLGMATTYTIVTYAATNLRGKDDMYGICWNHFYVIFDLFHFINRWNPVLGGFCSAGVYGAWMRCHVTGYTLGLFFGKNIVERLDVNSGIWWFGLILRNWVIMAVKTVTGRFVYRETVKHCCFHCKRTVHLVFVLYLKPDIIRIRYLVSSCRWAVQHRKAIAQNIVIFFWLTNLKNWMMRQIKWFFFLIRRIEGAK